MKGKWWVLKTTFFKENGWITQYGEMRNKKPLSCSEKFLRKEVT